jgi:hypothetical protein
MGDQPYAGLYLHRTTQHRKTKTKVRALSGIRTHGLSDQAIKAYAPDGATTGDRLKKLT